MSKVLSSKTHGFLFTWKVKNINVSFVEERITSPMFIIYKWYNSTWVMSLEPFKSQDGFNMNLEVIDIELTSVAGLSVVLTLTVCDSEGNEFILKENESFTFTVGSVLVEVASFNFFHYFSYSKETLVFNCHMELANLKVPLIRCIACTNIGSERRYFIWKVKNFANLLPNNPKNYKLFSTAPETPEVEVIGTLSNKSKFHIEIHVQSDKRMCIVGKISILTPKDELKGTKMKGFLVEKRSTSKIVYKFPLIIIRNCVLGDLQNGYLNLLCQFSFSTGEINSEIKESCYLPKEKFELLKRKLNNLTEEDSAVHASTGKTEKTLTPNVEDASGSVKKNRTPQALKEDLKNFYLKKTHCDVTFQTKTKFFPAHKSILCSRSPVFNAMFDTDMKETMKKKVDIDDLDADTLDQFLLFLYSEILEDFTWDRATKLLYAANKYDVESLKVECISFLLSNISVANVCEALKLSELYKDDKMKSACQSLILKHEHQIFSSKQWEILTLENPMLSAKTLQNHFTLKKLFHA